MRWYIEAPIYIIGIDLILLFILAVWLIFFDKQRSRD
jgi:hypothetical protein